MRINVALLGILCVASTGTAGDTDRARQVLAEYLTQTDALRQAEFELDEKVVYKKGISDRVVKRHILIDRDRGFARQDTDYQYENGGPHEEFTTIQNSDYRGSFRPRSGSFIVRDPQYEDDRRERILEVPLVGLLSYGGMTHGLSVADIEKSFSDIPEAGVTQDENQLHIVTLHEMDDGFKFRSEYVFRTDGGLRPIRKSTTRLEREGVAPERVTGKVVTQWQMTNGVWVPTHSTTTSDYMTATYKFTWKSVNEPLAAERFYKEDLSLPQGTAIVDSRTSKPSIDYIVGRTFGEHEDKTLVDWKVFVRNTVLVILVSLGVIIVIESLAALRRRQRVRLEEVEVSDSTSTREP